MHCKAIPFSQFLTIFCSEFNHFVAFICLLLKFLITPSPTMGSSPFFYYMCQYHEKPLTPATGEAWAAWHSRPKDLARPGYAAHLAPQKGLDTAFMRAGHHHTGTLCVFVFLEGKEKVSSALRHAAHLPSDPITTATSVTTKTKEPPAHCPCLGLF